MIAGSIKQFSKIKESSKEIKEVIYNRKSSRATSTPRREKYSSSSPLSNFYLEEEIVHLAKDSLFLFSNENKFRKKIQSILSSREYIIFINTVILLNCIFLIFETIDNMDKINFISNIIFTVIFTIECVMKITAYGFVLEEYTYLRDGWNWLDFIIAIFGLASLTSDVSTNLLVFRAFRLLRPLKTISILPHMKYFLSILLSSLIDLSSVLLMILFFFLIFAILGLSLWNDRYDYFCRTTIAPVNGVFQTDPVFSNTLCGGEVTCNNNLTLCRSARDYLNHGHYFFNPRFKPDDDLYKQELNYGLTNFNNIINAIFVVFQTTTIKGWTDIMYIYMNGYNYFVSLIYFCLCVIFNHYFLLNLSVAMLLYNFERNRSMEDSKVEAIEQRSLKETKSAVSPKKMSSPNVTRRKTSNIIDNLNKIVLKEVSMKKKYRRKYAPLQDISTFRSKNPKSIRNLLYALSKIRCFEHVKRTSDYHKKFYFGYSCYSIYKQPLMQYFFYTFIIANTIALLFNRFDQNEVEYETLEKLNILFVSVFTFEIVILLIGIGFYQFLKDFMNIWDFFVVFVSLIEIIILRNFLTIKYSASSISSIFRMLRILRIFRLFRAWRGFQVILASIKETLIRMADYIILFAIFIYIYTLLGCIFFQYSLRFDPITNNYSEYAPSLSTNFDDFLSSFISVLQVLIGDNWFQLYFDCYRSSANITGQTIFYFITLVLLGHIVMLNIFLAYLIDNFENARKFLHKNIKVKKYIQNVIYYCSKQHELDMVDYNSKNKNPSSVVSVYNFYLQKLENKKLLSEGRFVIAAKYELDFTIFKRKKTELYHKTGPEDRNERIIFFDEWFLDEKISKKNDFDPDEMEFYEFGFEFERKIEDNSELIKRIDLNSESNKSSDKFLIEDKNKYLSANAGSDKNLREDDKRPTKKLTIVHEKTLEEISQNPIIDKIDDNISIYPKINIDDNILSIYPKINIEIHNDENFYHSNLEMNEENLPISLKDSMQTEENILETDSKNNSASEIKPVMKDQDDPGNACLNFDNVDNNLNNRLSIAFGLNQQTYGQLKNNFTHDDAIIKLKKIPIIDYESEKPRISKSLTNKYIYNYRGIRNFLSEKEICTVNPIDNKKILIISEDIGEDFRIKNYKTYEERNNIILEELISNPEHNYQYENSDSDSLIESNSSPSLVRDHEDSQIISNNFLQDKYLGNSEKKIKNDNSLRGFANTIDAVVNSTSKKTNVIQSFKQRMSARSLVVQIEEQDVSTVKKIGFAINSHIRNSSLCIFHKNWRIRKFITKVIENRIFDYFLTVVILGNCIIICLETPLIDPNGSYAIILKFLNNVLGVVFILEALLKIIAYGLFFKSDVDIELPKSIKTGSFIEDARSMLMKSSSPPLVEKNADLSQKEKLNELKHSIKAIENQTAYLRNTSNIIDFLVVIVSILDLIGLKSIRYLNTMRALRSLRPIRLLTKNRNLKLMITCLLKSIPAMTNVLVVCSVFILIYAILGVSLFKSDLNYYCTTPYFYTSNDCVQNGGMWIYNYENFSNILFAFKTLFELMMSQGWITIMNVASQSISKWVYLYYIPYVIIAYFFILNLLVSIVIHKFKILKNKENHFSQLTEEEREWVKVQKVMMKYRPVPKLKIDKERRCMGLLYRLVLSKKFDNAILIAILLSLTSLIMQVNGHFAKYDFILDYINYFFTFLFNIEITLKILVYGKLYFKNGWNIFDFTIILICDIMAVISIVSYFFPFQNLTLSAFPIIIRSLRFLRAVRILTLYSKLRALIDTLLYLIPTILNIGIIYSVLIIVYGCIGMNIFGTMPYRENIDSLNNFQNFLSSALLLFRITTGEKWNSIMNEMSYHNCSYANPYASTDYYCLKYNYTCYSADELNYTLLVDGGYSCGSDFSYFYFISFMILGPVFILNLCVVMVIEGFSESMYENSGLLSQEYMDNFVSVWMNYDPECQKLVRPHELVLILKEMFPPFGFNYDRFFVSDPSKMWAQRQKLLLFRRVLEEKLSISSDIKNTEFDCDYQDDKFKMESSAYDFKSFYLSKNKKFNTTDLEVLQIMNKFKFSAVEKKGLFKKNHSYTITNLLKKNKKPSTLIENDKGLYIHFVDACLGLSRFVVSKNNNIGFDKFRENVVNDFTKKMWGGNYLPNEIALCLNEKEIPNRVSECLSLRMISKVKMLFVKKLQKVRAKILARNIVNNKNQHVNNEDFEDKEKYLCEMNPEFLNHRFNSKLFDDVIIEDKLETENNKQIIDDMHMRFNSNSEVSEASSVLRRNKNMTVAKQKQPKNLNNMFYDFKQIGELNGVENDSQMDDIKDEIDAYLEMNRNPSH